MATVERTAENLSKCLCMGCPTYKLGCKVKNLPKNMMTKIKGNIGNVEHFEGFFCAFEKSNCIDELAECVCETCDVFKENKLTNYGFCTVDGGLKSHLA